MGERQTGATNAQVGLAVERAMIATLASERRRSGVTLMVEQNAEYLVPPGSVICGPDDHLSAETRATLERMRDLIAAVREFDGYYDFGPESNDTDGVCPACQSGFGDASGVNAARANVYVLLDDVRFCGDEDRLAALVDGGAS